MGHESWWSGDDWGVNYDKGNRGNLTAWSWPGLDSGLRIERKDKNGTVRVLDVSVRPGLIHPARFHFGDVAFVEGGRDCLVEANGYVYLLDLPNKRLGTLVKGDRFIQLTSRYEKAL